MERQDIERGRDDQKEICLRTHYILFIVHRFSFYDSYNIVNIIFDINWWSFPSPSRLSRISELNSFLFGCDFAVENWMKTKNERAWLNVIWSSLTYHRYQTNRTWTDTKQDTQTLHTYIFTISCFYSPKSIFSHSQCLFTLILKIVGMIVVYEYYCIFPCIVNDLK